MKKVGILNYLPYIILVCLTTTGDCQKWISQTNRIGYSVNGGQLNVTWQFEAQNYDLLSALWNLVQADNKTKPLLLVGKSNAVTVYSQEIHSNTIGDVKFLNLTKDVYKKIVVSISLKHKETGDFASLSDTLTIQYIDKKAYFSRSLESPLLQVLEGSSQSKNKVLTVVAKGKPKPTVYWRLNGINASEPNVAGFRVEETITTELDDIQVVTSKLTMSALMGNHNGNLTVTTFYGDYDDLSPKEVEVIKLDILYPPKNISLTTNITTFSIVDEAYVGFTCSSPGNPLPNYTITETSTVVYKGKSQHSSIFINKNYHTRFAVFKCKADNLLGVLSSEPLTISVLNGAALGKSVNKKDTDWWVYYAVVVGIGCVIFVGVAITTLIIRSRMRSMNVRNEVTKVKMRSMTASEVDYEKKAMRHNAPNHVYDLNQRGAPDGKNNKSLKNFPQRDISRSAIDNQGFDVHDDIEAFGIN